MSKVETDFRNTRSAPIGSGWSELWLKEDWWAIWLGLGIIVAGLILFAEGASWRRYVVHFALWTAAFAVGLPALGHKAREFLRAFALLYVFSVIVFAIGQWDQAVYYDLEPPLVALVLGLALSNLIGLPRWLDA